MRLSHLMVGAALLLISGCGGGGGGSSTPRIALTAQTASLAPNASEQITATIPNIFTPHLIWSIQEGAAGGTITQGGLYTAPALAGTYHILVNGPIYNNASGELTITVHVVVNVTPAVGNTGGAPVQFSAAVLGSPNQTVVWSVEEGAAGGTITQTGLYTPPLAGGTFHVIATSTVDHVTQGIAVVNVGAGSASGTIQ